MEMMGNKSTSHKRGPVTILVIYPKLIQALTPNPVRAPSNHRKDRTSQLGHFFDRDSAVFWLFILLHMIFADQGIS